jgi:hypothetical protein
MRGFKKFLFRNKWHIYSFFLKKRILNFKRTKWKKIKSKIFYSIRQYNTFKKRLISVKFCRFLKNIKFLKIKIKTNKLIFNLKFLNFFKTLKNFLISKKYKKLKRNLKYKLNFFFKKPFYKKYNYFKKCFNLFFFNFKIIKISNKQHIKNKFFFKNILYNKASIIKYFFGCFSTKFFKKVNLTSNYKQNLILTFIQPELRLDILLWRLKFFKSPYLARFAFQKNLILINQLNNFFTSFNKYHFKRFLKKGDIISFKFFLKYQYKLNLNAITKSLYLPTLFELDYYTNNIIILKDLNLNFQDLNSLIKEPLNFYYFKNYLFK